MKEHECTKTADTFTNNHKGLKRIRILRDLRGRFVVRVNLYESRIHEYTNTINTKLSESIQDYLKAIYELRNENERAMTNALASKLNIAAASVTGMLQKLSEMKLVVYEKHRGASLTPAGEKIALEVIRHHRLIEMYLMQAMGYSWDQVHAEADKLEHAISEEFEDRISQMLGDPKIDPHGDPIPTKDGFVAATSRETLANAKVGARVCVQRVRDENPALLRRVAELNLIPKSVITVQEKTNDRVVVVDASNAKHVVERIVAENIFVVEE